MKRFYRSICCSMAAAVTGTVVVASSPDGSGINAIWNDPSFQKQFVAGYGVNAEIEPRIDPEDVATLEKVRPLMASDLAKAAAALSKAIKPECSAILDFTLAGIYFQQDDMAQAQDWYQKAVTKFPSFRRAYRNLGLIHTRNGKYDDAIRSFTRMIELGGGDAYSFGLLGVAYSAKQDFLAAEAAYRNALLLQPENTEWRLGLTRCVFKQQKFEDAATLLGVLIEQYPDRTEFWLLQANAYVGMKQPLRAAENLECLDRAGKGTVESLVTLGDIYANENMLELAARAYKRAIDADEQQPLARPVRSAEILAGRGGLAQAQALTTHIKQVWDKRMTDDERRKLLKLEARLALATGLGDDQVAKVLEEAVKLDPLDGEALLLLGQHCMRANKPEQAIFYYERAAGLEKFEAEAKIRQAQILVGQSKFKDALPLLRRAQEIKPRDDLARYVEQVERVARSR